MQKEEIGAFLGQESRIDAVSSRGKGRQMPICCRTRVRVNARSHSNGHGVEFLAAVYVSNGVSNKHDVFTLESALSAFRPQN